MEQKHYRITVTNLDDKSVEIEAETDVILLVHHNMELDTISVSRLARCKTHTLINCIKGLKSLCKDTEKVIVQKIIDSATDPDDDDMPSSLNLN